MPQSNNFQPCVAILHVLDEESSSFLRPSFYELILTLPAALPDEIPRWQTLALVLQGLGGGKITFPLQFLSVLHGFGVDSRK